MASLRLSSSLTTVGTASAWRPSLAPRCRCVDRRVAYHHAPQRSLALARAIPVSGPGAATVDPSGAPAGQISSELISSMKAKISEALETQNVQVVDVYGDGRHVSIDVVSPVFEGKSAVQRQRMVYKAIWLELQEAVHAVDAMTTKTPSEASA